MIAKATQRAACCTAVLLCATSGPVHAATNALLRWGTLATLAPLCGLRDETWAFDLRRAELQDATGSTRSDDASLHAAPGSNEAAAALSYAEAEALEEFAVAPAEHTCHPLAGDPDLARADEIVQAFRARRMARPGS